MNNRVTEKKLLMRLMCGLGLLLYAGSHAQAQAVSTDAQTAIGPYEVRVMLGGGELRKAVAAGSVEFEPGAGYTLSMWVRWTEAEPARTLIAGVGDPAEGSSWFLGLEGNKPLFYTGAGQSLIAPAALPAGVWHLLGVTLDGSQASLWADGLEVAQGPYGGGRPLPQLRFGPVSATSADGWGHFGGEISGFLLEAGEIDATEIRRRVDKPPNDALLRFEEASKPWPIQMRGQAGMLAPQSPATLPKGIAPYSIPIAKPLPLPAPALQQLSPEIWKIANGWKLQAAPQVSGEASAISVAGYRANGWMDATVPGTVLTTMIDRGVYPDPDYGLNNMAIPESLNKQDYWYRVEFPTPAATQGRHAVIDFEGINYAAEAWLNGRSIGKVRGAFLRGQFDITGMLKATGANVLAVKISPPPHPGIPHEQSILAGAGDNGGALCLDGPTFVATEGWDWIPAIRDRDTGIWQDVLLKVSGALRIGDPKIVTHLPLPRLDSADLDIDVPITNLTHQATQAILHASFEGSEIATPVQLAPGENLVRLCPATQPRLHVEHPRLWWPNGYGDPALYHLKLSVQDASGISDATQLTFGIREITYELSLFDHTGALRRVEVAPARAASLHQQVVNVRHEAMRQTAEYYAPSLTAEGERSAAVKPVNDESGLTDLVLKVNGVRIAARGGNWGMDDSRKRVSREHLEPFFRLHREAHLNIIRNWVGQNTEETFFQLADEYGLMVWNDFWASTQDSNVEPEDVPLFLANARDVVRRFRNHPSIVLWCGRNEGVPQPILNEGLIQMFAEEDGTRYYTPGSNRIDLRNSGPYNYQDPALYFSKFDKGFSVELGIPSLSTLESLRASIPLPDQWPVSDAWAYHDWHFGGNGNVTPLLQHLDRQFGRSNDLEDFERKAQMYNYVAHRAIFEGFNQHLWSPNSGRMLWMTQPAWPSNMWQILSSDYDTQASFYAVKKASEPLHAQLDLSDFTVAAVNLTREDAPGMYLHARVLSLSNQSIFEQNQRIDLRANSVAPLFQLKLGDFMEANPAMLVELTLTNASGFEVSRNLYWIAGKEENYTALNTLAPAVISGRVTERRDGPEKVVEVHLENVGESPALMLKATLFTGKGERILPAYFSDNYVSLLPGEKQTIEVRFPADAGSSEGMEVALRGWNKGETILPMPVQQ